MCDVAQTQSQPCADSAAGTPKPALGVKQKVCVHMYHKRHFFGIDMRWWLFSALFIGSNFGSNEAVRKYWRGKLK